MSAASTGVTNTTNTQDQQTNGTLDSNALGNDAKRIKNESADENNDGVDGNNLGGGSSNDVNEVIDGETTAKRMRTNNTGNALSSAGGAVSNATAGAQNNTAYAAAAQSYHNTLAAINYTGVALQTNKNPQQPHTPVSVGANALQGLPTAGGLPQQQQFLAQYQAMLAALSNPAALQGNLATAAGAAGQPQQPNLTGLAPQAQLNPAFAAIAAMNPLLAASLPQFAAQRATLMTGQQGSAAALQNAQLNQLAAAGLPTSNIQFNPLMGMQFANQAAGAGLPLQQNQQALLAAYGQIARGPVPAVVSGAPTVGSQQLFVPNPAAAAAAQLATNGALQAGVKRMRPT